MAGGQGSALDGGRRSCQCFCSRPGPSLPEGPLSARPWAACSTHSTSLNPHRDPLARPFARIPAPLPFPHLPACSHFRTSHCCALCPLPGILFPRVATWPAPSPASNPRLFSKAFLSAPHPHLPTHTLAPLIKVQHLPPGNVGWIYLLFMSPREPRFMSALFSALSQNPTPCLVRNKNLPNE